MKQIVRPHAGARSRPGDFASFALRQDLLRAVKDMGFDEPTPIQVDAIPPALAGRDVLACAMTGSGKTAAFLLPILQRIAEKPRGVTRALVITPTRELAAQIDDERARLARYTGTTGAAVFGGVGMGPQTQAFRRGVDIVVGTPGRLLDHFQYDYATLHGIEVLVLDEADRMLDMGFLPDIRRVLRHLPSSPRQTFFLSATMPAPIVELSREMLSSPARIDIERKQAPATGVAQALYPVPQNLKVDLLLELLERDEVGNVIVFCRTKHRTNRLAQKLEKRGINVARIHGNRSQKQRTEALDGFKAGRYRVLAATDIVARGIDVEALDHVLNFDVPPAAEDYIHRVGRTARAGATGDAYTFVAPEEESEIRAIERALGKPIERRKLEGFDYAARVSERFEVPIGERIAEIRARKADERARARAKAERRAGGANGGRGSNGTAWVAGTQPAASPRRRNGNAAGSEARAGSGSQGDHRGWDERSPSRGLGGRGGRSRGRGARGS